MLITIHTAMLVALGFLAAALLVLLLAPFYRRRTTRLATEELRRTLPLTETEIRADKDRLRADFAVHIHELEQRAEKDALAAARQRIELNRRDAAISGLEGEVARLRTSLDEHENARRVLEQTITDRLPKVEQRLAEAKRMLAQRDREIAQLSETAASHSRALEEATQINTQQRDELHRLNAALTTRAARNREGLGDPRFDGEVALRSEIEALRAKTREQAALVSRLQGLLVRQGGAGAEASTEGRSAAAGSGLAGASIRAEEEIRRLRSDLAEAEDALRTVRSSAEAGKAGQEALDREARSLKAATQDQGAEIARLKAALAAYEGAEKDDKAIKDSKISMKARLSALEAENGSQAGTIQTLRAEVAAANERLARQAAHFRDEMRRLGAGTLPTTAQARKATVEPMRKPLTDRIAEPRLVAVPKLVADEPAAAVAAAEEGKRVSGFLKALEGGADEGAGAKSGEPAAAEPAAAVGGEPKPRRRGGLIERITGLDKTSA